MDREIVRGGETGGRLDDAMGYLSDYYGRDGAHAARNPHASRLSVFLLHFGAFMLAVPALVQDGAEAFFAQVAGLLGIFYVAGALAWFGFVIAVREAKGEPRRGSPASIPAVLGRARVALVSARFCLLMAFS